MEEVSDQMGSCASRSAWIAPLVRAEGVTWVQQHNSASLRIV